ncbi:uncharacterized protein [Spinacia oleracea]|uniref:Transmembrane protein n=1 Tax=Spinacia oleracea TaxID=3562 RepID=A0A9R0J3Z1_SPIOL|nr:uncharacterized protein LOC110798621 [Spinacia oleracea]
MAQTNYNALLRSSTSTIVVVLILLYTSSLEAKADELKTLNNVPSEFVESEPRKFGNHGVKSHDTPPSITPSQPPEGHNNSVKTFHVDATSSDDEHQHQHQLSPHPHLHFKEPHAHHHTDKSVAGGGVIIACLATAFVLSIFCYIRATRQQIISKEQLI